MAVIAAVVAVSGATLALAVATAQRWSAIDVPAQPETFRTELYYTGRWMICFGFLPIEELWSERATTPGLVSDPSVVTPLTCTNTAAGADYEEPLCLGGQEWSDCFEAAVIEYERECTGAPLTEVAQLRCDGYQQELDVMEGLDEPGAVVGADGGDYLRSIPEMEPRQVSNNDARPAVAHEAVCYFGLLGECPDSADIQER